MDRYPENYMSALLQRNHNLAYKLPEGYIFLRVLDYEDSQYYFQQYDTVAAQSASSSIAGGPTADWHRWDPWGGTNYDLLEERECGYILQAFVGIDPPTLRWWKRFPSPIPRGSLDRIKITGLDDTQPGYLDGMPWGSPYDMPTALSELIIPTNFPAIEFGIYNMETFPVTPKFRIPIRRLQVKALEPDKPGDKQLINEMIQFKRPCKVWSPGVGGYQYNARQNFGVCPVPWEVL